MDDALFEHRFWLQILGDHSRFIYNSLSPNELQDIVTADDFIQLFDQLLDQARQLGPTSSLQELNQRAYEASKRLRAFKLDLLNRALLGKVSVGLSPTFFNHMVNELEEYILILEALLEGKPVPTFHALHHDMLWLNDAAGHASSIASSLDEVEKRFIQQSREFEQHFDAFYLKAVQFIGYLRTLQTTYPSLKRFHQDVNMEMVVFMGFLTELEELGLSAELLSRLNPLIPDHMYREECYYLLKLSQSGDVPAPNCDPAKPRVS
ncbi:hypothetical protein BVG16_02565 [Paenibacillus selenitireducens]|uniref:DUF2935 domain-containing protein n=1 Tax=Paenibacillus selenitireducens TaxID=1324314 RepID=A0A1T2XMY5_9BACL|nr:DUF2935 domain-containing protein [Paenibacillus selenitireducens]OPA81224.1 hypothetical protein BVG16_02565 [Paenibacillus selenitireducens]